MFLQGNDSSVSGDRLSWLNESDLFRMLCTFPDSEHESKVNSIRDISRINLNEAEKRAKELPYFTCCRFNPMNRREENFVWSEHLCIEVPIPSFDSREQYLEWRATIQKHRNAAMAFVSAVGDRLLLIFNLKKPCYDRGLFRLFYREFANSFFDECGLSYIPSHPETDPTKAIPISIDPDAYLCYNVKPIRIEDYLNMRTLYELQSEKQRNSQINKRTAKKKQPQMESVSDEALSHIKSILGVGKANRCIENKKNLANDLRSLDGYMESLRKSLNNKGFILSDVQVLSSGRKLFIDTNEGTVVINYLLDTKHNRSVVPALNSSAPSSICTEVKHLIEKFLKEQE